LELLKKTQVVGITLICCHGHADVRGNEEAGILAVSAPGVGGVNVFMTGRMVLMLCGISRGGSRKTQGMCMVIG
jgi:hypothetical protein